MTLAVRVLGGVCIVGACFLALPPPADTETVKWREVFRKGQVHLVPVGDADGHFIGLAHQRGLALFGSGEVARILVRFTFDGTREKTEYQGCGLYAFKDGSRVFVRFQGHGIKPTEQEGTLSFLRGTGRFKRIEGGAMWTAVPLPPFSSGARKSVSVTANIRCPPADSCPASLPAFVDPDPPPMEGDLSLGGLPGRASLDLLPGALGPKRDDIPTRADPPEAEDPRRDGTNGMDQGWISEGQGTAFGSIGRHEVEYEGEKEGVPYGDEIALAGNPWARYAFRDGVLPSGIGRPSR